jgi:hypothetical protein
MTPEEIEDQVRTDHPEFRVSEGDEVMIISPESDPERYEEMVAERVAWRIEQQERDVLQSHEDARAAQVKLRYDALKAGTATSKQVQEVVAHLLRLQYRDLAP